MTTDATQWTLANKLTCNKCKAVFALCADLDGTQNSLVRADNGEKNDALFACVARTIREHFCGRSMVKALAVVGQLEVQDNDVGIPPAQMGRIVGAVLRSANETRIAMCPLGDDIGPI